MAVLVDQEGTVNPDVTRRSDEKKKSRHRGEGAVPISVQDPASAKNEAKRQLRFGQVWDLGLMSWGVVWCV